MNTLLPHAHPWSDRVHILDSVDSTNTYAKQLAFAGAPHGTCVFAHHQTNGRGRMDRSFSSPQGLGMYLSVILRPNCPASQLMGLTCAVGVAASDGVQKLCGLTPGLKWINDLVCGTKKLGGILCELSIEPASGNTNFAIVGIGINCLQKTEDFPAELQSMATSLLLETGKAFTPAQLAGAIITALSETELPPVNIDRYRSLCVTLGKQVQILQGESTWQAHAISVDRDGGLVVELPDGQIRTVSSGEVSVRGMYGYCP